MNDLHGFGSFFNRVDRGELLGPAKTPRRGRHMCRMIPTGEPELDKMVIRPVIHRNGKVTFAHWNEEKNRWEVLRNQEFICRSDWETLPTGERERLERGGVKVEP